jgi:hypothetical protein
MTTSKQAETKDGETILIPEVMRDAYDWGYERFHLALADKRDLTDSEREEVSMNLDMFTETAEWANSILPALRAMAGYSDGMGVGTYNTLEGTLEVVDPESYKDQEVKRVTGKAEDIAPEILDGLVSEFFQGAWDGATAETL